MPQLLIFALLTLAAATIGSQFRPDAWYTALAKPDWTPPGWIFPPVWTTLYVMIAIAGWLASRSSERQRLVPIWLVGIVLNGAWSWLFFGRHEIGLALLDIALLWGSILAFIVTAWRPARLAALLFVPYFAWVSFASVLNFTIWRLNG